MEFEGKVAVITGAASGIGRAVAIDLARRNIRAMALVDMGEVIDGVAAEINTNARRQRAYPYRNDYTDGAFRASFFDSISSRIGIVPICVPMSGLMRDDVLFRTDGVPGGAWMCPA